MWWPRLTALLSAATLLLAWRALPGAAPPGASLEVRSVPGGAEVLLDSAPMGQSNLSLSGLRTGPVEVLVRRTGYKPARQRLNLESGKTALVSVALDPEPQEVSLKVSGPERYRIELGPGESQSYDDPKKLLLVPGRYQLTGHADGYRDLKQKLEVRPGQARPVALEFVRGAAVAPPPAPTPVPIERPIPPPPAAYVPPPRPAYVPPTRPAYVPPARPAYVPPPRPAYVPHPIFTPVAPPPIAPVLTPLP